MENRIHLPRYTVLKIKEVKISGPGSLVILSLEDRHGSLYETEVDLKYDVIVKNENYIEDLFGFGDIHQKYPAITDKRWAIIARGDLEEGMNTDECRLSIGDPVEIQLKKTVVSKLGSTTEKRWNLRVASCNVSNKRSSDAVII